MDSLPPGTQNNEEEAKRVQEEQQRRDMMAAVLDTAARERLSRIALVSPERAKQIEGILLRMATTGQLKGRVTEEQLIGLLDQMESGSQGGVKKPTIVFQRRKGLDDDELDI